MYRILISVTILLFFIHVVELEYMLKDVDIPNDLSKYTIFNTDELAKYDGSKDDLPIYMAIKGVVFDVSSGKDYYGKKKSYNALVGKDATRAVAKMSLDPNDLNNDLTGLSESVLKSLDDIFDGTYVAKYPIVGYMDFLVRNRDKDL